MGLMVAELELADQEHDTVLPMRVLWLPDHVVVDPWTICKSLLPMTAVERRRGGSIPVGRRHSAVQLPAIDQRGRDSDEGRNDGENDHVF